MRFALDRSVADFDSNFMTVLEIVRESSHLPAEQQCEVQQAVEEIVKARFLLERDLAAAAGALLKDYQTDPELTAFSVLDIDDIHGAR